MNDDWCLVVNASCPLPIESVFWDDPVLVLSGSNWSFTCTSSWRIVSGDRMVAGCEEVGAAEEALRAISGLQVLRCVSLVRPSSGDLRLVLSGEMAVEVFVATPVDPWVFRLPDGPTLVPSPGDPAWFTSTGR